jgi:FAD synthase
MRPLVYDFGQLSKTTESDYIEQIVRDHVSCDEIVIGMLLECTTLDYLTLYLAC